VSWHLTSLWFFFEQFLDLTVFYYCIDICYSQSLGVLYALSQAKNTLRACSVWPPACVLCLSAKEVVLLYVGGFVNYTFCHIITCGQLIGFSWNFVWRWWDYRLVQAHTSNFLWSVITMQQTLKVVKWEDDPPWCHYPWFSAMTDDLMSCDAIYQRSYELFMLPSTSSRMNCLVSHPLEDWWCHHLHCCVSVMI
jgi:hypothetical protein